MISIKIVLSIICLFSLGIKNSDSNIYSESDYIEWSSARKLKWDDFQGIPDSASRASAISSIGVKLEYKLSSKRIRRFKVVCYFSKSKSWHTDTTAYGLNHEQRHFDIGEVHARMLRAKLTEMRNLINKNNQEEIRVLYYSYKKMLVEEQDNYDTETNRGINTYQQQEWNEKIDKELERLKEYELK